MNQAEKYLQKNIKTVEINGVDFLIRKYNPEDVFIMGQHLALTRDRAKERLKTEDKDCKDCPDEPLKFTMTEIQELGELDLKVVLTRCVLNPKIVMKEFGKQNKNEIPYDIVDSNTANKLFKEVESYSLEVFEGVSFDSFPDERAGGDSNEDGTDLEHTSEPVSKQLSPEDESLPEDEIGQSIHSNERVGDRDKVGTISKETKRTRRTKKQTRIEREIQKKNNK